jgi:hypothetical protein
MLLFLDIMSTELRYWIVAADPLLHVDTPCRIPTSSLNVVLSHKQRYTKRAAAQPSQAPPLGSDPLSVVAFIVCLLPQRQHGFTSKPDSCVARNRYILAIYNRTVNFSVMGV